MEASQALQIVALKDEIVALKAIILTQSQRIAELEATLNQNSQNSSRAPSTDGPNVKPAPPRTPSGRKRGAQPGHEFLERKILTPDVVHDYRPSCTCCGNQLHGDDPDPIIDQVIELPEKLRHVTHHRRHRLTCPTCQVESAAAPVPEAAGGFGPRLQVLTAYLSGACRLGKRTIHIFYRDVCDIPMSCGSICKMDRKISAALEPIHDEASIYIQGRDANFDETGWREGNGGKPADVPHATRNCDEPVPYDEPVQDLIKKKKNPNKAWLWVAVTLWLAVFIIRRKRDRTSFNDLAGPDPGVLTTDRYSVYTHLTGTKRQVCWAHLRRDFQAMIDRKNAGSAVGEKLLEHSEILFEHWQKVRDGTMLRKTFRKNYASWLRGEVQLLLERGAACGCAKTEVVCREIASLEESLWTFASRDGVEPTNNAAERELRHAVCWRKTSYGTDSERGSRFVERILTVIASCRRQKRNAFEFIVQAVEAHAGRAKRPSLIPVGV